MLERKPGANLRRILAFRLRIQYSGHIPLPMSRSRHTRRCTYYGADEGNQTWPASVFDVGNDVVVARRSRPMDHEVTDYSVIENPFSHRFKRCTIGRKELTVLLITEVI